MWHLDLEEEYFYKIYDSKKQIAGYFDPDYGKIHSPDTELEQIVQMHKNADKIKRGFLTLPMVKFGIFSEDSMTVDKLSQQIQQVNNRILHWQKFISTIDSIHSISVSHTDHDMLSITIEIKFGNAIPLDKKIIQEKLEPVLNQLQTLGLL